MGALRENITTSWVSALTTELLGKGRPAQPFLSEFCEEVYLLDVFWEYLLDQVPQARMPVSES